DYLSRTGKQRLMGRLAAGRLWRPDFIWSPYQGFSSRLDQNTTGLALSLTSTLSPALTNEARGGYSTDLIQFDRPHPEIPTLIVSDFDGGDSLPVALPGSLAAYEYRNHSRTLEFVDDLVWTRGRHVYKFGGGFLLRGLDGFLTY